MKEFEGGRCLVSNRVIDQMLALRAAEVDGVLAVAGFDPELGTLRRGYERYIVTETENGELTTELSIMVNKDRVIVQVVRDVQEAVCQEVEAVLGLACRRVNVHVL